MTDAEKSSIGEVFEGSQLMIPRYQRSYSWGSQQVDDLLRDLEYVYDKQILKGKDSATHYFGTIILEKRSGVQVTKRESWTRYNVIDGQQRLLTITALAHSISKELEQLDERLSVESERVLEAPEEVAAEVRDLYIEKKDTSRMKPEDLVRDTYTKLMIEDIPAENLLEDSRVPLFLSGRRLAEAKLAINQWLDKWQEAFVDSASKSSGEASDIEYYDFLQDILGILRNDFAITTDVVEDMDEAARMFKVINDRGKDLTISEKVKSHLMYCGAQTDKLDTEHICSVFNDAVQTITMDSGTDDSDVDEFLKSHWVMFTGETDFDRSRSTGNAGIHRRIKDHYRYANIERDDYNIWVTRYVESLSDAADHFRELNNPEVFKEIYKGNKASIVVNRLQSLKNASKTGFSSMLPLLMAVKSKFGYESEDFLRIITLCEVFSFRYQQVLKRTGTATTYLQNSSHRFYWLDTDEDELAEIFNEEMYTRTMYEDASQAVRDFCKTLTEKIDEKCDDEVFAEYLNRRDIIGGEFSDNWRGVRSKSVLRYFLFEYERYLRNGSDSDLHQMGAFNEWDDSFHIEHIAPQSPEGKGRLNPHKKNVNKLGNLALLGPSDNRGLSNKSYEEKYTNLYRDSTLKMLSELPEGEWNVREVDSRTDELVAFALKRWSTDWLNVDEFEKLSK